MDPQSATLGSGSNEKQIPIDADHRQMCKFESMEEPTYDQVSKNLVELIESAIQFSGRHQSMVLRGFATAEAEHDVARKCKFNCLVSLMIYELSPSSNRRRRISRLVIKKVNLCRKR